MTNEQKAPKVLKESKNKIKVDFERTSAWTRFRLKYLSLNFLATTLYRIFRFVLLVGVSYVILYPFFAKIAASFMSPDDFVDVTVKLIPKHFTLDQYKYIITENSYFKAMFNTATLSLMCGVVQTFICSFIGYGFAKYKFKGNKLLFMLVVFTMVVPHEVIQLSMFFKFRYFDILFPNIAGLFNEAARGKVISGVFEQLKYLFDALGIFKKFPSSLKLIDSNWPLAILSLTGLGFKNGLYIFIMRQFFRGVPDELEESAYIDGSGVFKTFFTIIIPLSIPMMVTIFLFAFSWQWTDNFYSELLYVSSKSLLLPKIVRIPKSLNITYAGSNLYNSAIYNTCAMMIIAPLIVIYLFCQKSLVQGIERSGIIG